MSFALLAAAVYLGGVLTILSPCILPVLPLVLTAAGRPFARWSAPMLVGLVATFVAVATIGTVGAAWLAHVADGGRWVALAAFAVVGAALLSPRLATVLTRPGVRLGAALQARLAATETYVAVVAERTGNDVGNDTEDRSAPLRAFGLGAATALLWAPCAGPVLGLVVTLAASRAAPEQATALLALFGAGAATALATVLLAGGRAVGALRRAGGGERWARRTLGALALAAVVVIALGWDATLLSRGGLVQTAAAEEVILARLAPTARASVTAAMAAAVAPEPLPAPPVPTPDLGPLPDFAGGTQWLNASGLGVAASGGTVTAASLRGKVVVVNVWTFACYNCLNALPHVKALAAKYKGQDVVVIGVHTPELARERIPANVADAVQRLGVTYPVVLDPAFKIWGAFHNQYWPSLYIADRTGRIRFQHFGEGRYDDEDRVVAQLLREPAK